ncbi:MAG: hypothetical protein QME59_06745, partial [Candidatus Hydrothermarchaeota archaeon]|nr:hypothetical protein [Candidatus Hydrothermarchaeota archaeon]
QTLSAEGAKYLFIITGSAFVYPEMHEVAEPFTRLFERFEIDNFDLEGAREAITKPLKVEKIPLKVSENVVKMIHKITEGHPFFIVAIMRDILRETKEGTISMREFENMSPRIIEHLTRTKFQDDFNKATDAEKAVLLEIAQLDKRIFAPLDVKAKSQAKIFERLTKKDLLIKISRGKYRVYHPLFLEYLHKLRRGI